MSGTDQSEGNTRIDADSTPNDAADVSSLAKSNQGREASVEGTANKKKSKKAKDGDSPAVKPAAKLTDKMADSLLELNPSLKGELAGMDRGKAAELMRKMDVSELLTGLSVGGKNQKDMASFKFWQTQPVARFDDKGNMAEGPIIQINPEQVPKEPDPLIEGFEWVTLDLTDEKELQELYELLAGHYVEDHSAMFRFNYSIPFLNWFVPPPIR